MVDSSDEDYGGSESDDDPGPETPANPIAAMFAAGQKIAAKKQRAEAVQVLSLLA